MVLTEREMPTEALILSIPTLSSLESRLMCQYLSDLLEPSVVTAEYHKDHTVDYSMQHNIELHLGVVEAHLPPEKPDQDYS